MEKLNNNEAKIAVLIPCYNERQTIKKVVEDFRNALPEADIYVYDNNSSDHTDDIAREAGAIVNYEYKQGKGNVIRSMFRNIQADCYLMIDGDDTYSPDYARKMVSLVLNNNYDMVIGDRLSSTYFIENKRAFHNFGNVLVRKLVNFLFKGDITDIMTGYRAFSPLFVKSFPVLAKGFEIETEMTIHALDKNLNIKSVPITYRDRPDGSVSKLNTYRDGYKVIMTIFRLFKDFKPLSFFSIISLLLFIGSVLLFTPAFIGYINTGLVTKIPSLIVSVFFALAAIQTFVCGVILDTVSSKHRQLFEMQLNKLILHSIK